MTSPRRRTILDPIYGNVALSQEELEVVDHRIFRRLHQIRQNGPLYMVFPGATHTRFEHSIGVLSCANDLLLSLEHNSEVASGKSIAAVADARSVQPGEAVDFSSVSLESREAFARAVRLAALVHDLGHGPFSHHFDPFAPPREKIAEFLRTDNRLVAIERLNVMSSHEGTATVPHETMSCVFFSLIAKDLGMEHGLVREVVAIILGEPDVAHDSSIAELLLLGHDLVASAPADADRMDYLERDSRSVGVRYGLFDRNRLLRTFLPYRSPGQNRERSLRLGMKKSGLRAVENFVQARFELFVQVYYHKTNRGLQLMLGEIASMVREAGASIFDWEDLSTLVTNYMSLTDERFLRILCGDDCEWRFDSPDVAELARKIRERKIWKRIYEGPQGEEMQAAILSAIPGVRLVLDRIEPKATKDLGEGAGLLARSGDGKYRLLENENQSGSWLEASPIIRALHENEKNIQRLYLQDTSDDLVNRCKEIVWGTSPTLS